MKAITLFGAGLILTRGVYGWGATGHQAVGWVPSVMLCSPAANVNVFRIQSYVAMPVSDVDYQILEEC